MAAGATTTAPPGGPPGKGGGLLGKLKRKPALAAAVIGGGGLGVLLLLKKGKSNAAGDAGTGSAQPGTIDPSLYGTPADLAGSGALGATGDVSTIEAQLTGLQGQLAQIAQQTMPKTGHKPKPKPKPHKPKRWPHRDPRRR